MTEPSVADLMRERVLPNIHALHRWHCAIIADRGTATPEDIAKALQTAHELAMALSCVVLKLSTQINTPVTLHVPPSDEPHPRGH